MTTLNKSLIVIQIAAGYTKIEAEELTGYPVACAVHRCIGKPGWAVTATKLGAIICRGPTRREAIGNLEGVVANENNLETIRQAIQRSVPLPAADTVPLYAAPAVTEVTGADVEKIIALIADRCGLDAEEKKAVRRALSSRGKNAGRLLAKSPSAFSDPLGCAAWQAIQPNPFKNSVGACLFLRGEARALFEKLSKTKWPVWFDSDASALVDLGVW